MKTSKADLILHPVRMKIIQALATRKKRTASELALLMPDIPQATLYRHLKILLENQVLFVTEENPIRGTIEKVYALTVNGGTLTQEDLMNASSEDHMNYFMKYISGILGEFGDYLAGGEVDFVKDGIGYRKISLYMTDEEFLEYIHLQRAIYEKFFENEPSKNRKKRTISTITISDRRNSDE